MYQWQGVTMRNSSNYGRFVQFESACRFVRCYTTEYMHELLYTNLNFKRRIQGLLLGDQALTFLTLSSHPIPLLLGTSSFSLPFPSLYF